MLNLIIWVLYGLVVGLIAKAIYKYPESPKGVASTLAIGICGSFVGGFINYLISGGSSPLQPSGIFLGIVGGVVTSFLYRKFQSR